jgi:ADP-dependent NAD(P)H-hydrate dehydratase / NAD(P)H-hydrate epimerase
MLKILSASAIKQLDAFTIAQEPINSIDLMERAARSFCSWFQPKFTKDKAIGIVCGTGNNGGDGLAISRLLIEQNYNVKTWIIKGGNQTREFIEMHSRIRTLCPVEEITDEIEPALFDDCEVLIDAIFGSGINRHLDGIYDKTVTAMNEASSHRIAVDVPSGLLCDGASSGTIFNAHKTVTFQLPKLAFLLPENNRFVGEWSLLDIGLSSLFINSAPTNYYLTTVEAVRKILIPRKRFSHKGNFGHALLIAGSYGKMGACVLAAKAALRSGVGLLTVHVPRSGLTIMQTAVPEAMCSTDENENYFSAAPSLSKFNSIGIGPGLGKSPATVSALTDLMMNCVIPMVLDADALNCVAENPHLRGLVPTGSILTPHPKEFDRLVGSWANDFERLEKQRQLSKAVNSVIVLKGAFTSISTPDGKVYFNPTGNPGMATAGSGDVLTGILTGLMAQGYSTLNAALVGVYLHGLAGDLAIRELTMNSLIASDLINYLPCAFKELEKE